MYHCHVQFYFVGVQHEIFQIIQAAPEPEHFTYAFSRSSAPEEETLARADVILAGLSGPDAEQTLRALRAGKKKDAQIILLADRELADRLCDDLEEVTDLWIVPMPAAEAAFRFRRWQRTYGQSRELWQEEHFLDAYMNGSPNLVWYVDRDGVYRRVNDNFCRTMNKTRQQVEGFSSANVWGAEDDPTCVEPEEMEKRRTCVSEELVQTGEGPRLLTTYKSPVCDLDGSVMGTVGVAIDVTEERAYEQVIIEKSETLEKLFSTMNCGIMCHTIDGKEIISINQMALRLLGYDSQDELMKDGFDLVAQSVLDEDKPRFRECIKSLKHPGESVSVEYSVRHKDGQLLHILGNVKLMEEGGKLFYQRFMLDITEQKLKDEARWEETDQKLQYQEQMFEILVTCLANNLDDIYMVISEDGERIEFASPNAERVLGLSRKELAGSIRNIGNVKYLSGSAPTLEDVRALEPGMALEAVETERVNPRTGEHRWFQERVYCVLVQGVRKLVAYISDRTKEYLARQALAEALDIAQVANRAKTTFLGSVSHDIRTPMNAIMGLITLLREEAGNPEHVLEYTQKISAASQHLLGLINDVLDMNKIESGGTVLNISELSLAEIIDELNTIIRPQVRARNQTFDIYVNSITYEHLLGDKLRINQILINILSNAVKYTQEGGKIEMRVTELPQVNEKYDRVRFTISDNGQGMSEEYQKIIFDPFSREQTTTLNKIQGTGLGMAITKNLVDLMDGTIQVVSSPGEGSTFTVELELRIQERSDDPKFWERHNIRRMIVADDDEDNCLDIVKKMAETGVITHYATGGAEAIRMMRSAREGGHPYDLILLDWRMPDLDGMETARLIRKNYPVKIPILLFTAYDWGDIEEEAMELGIKHFLPKPFFMCNFREAIRRMMGTQEESAPVETGGDPIKGAHILVVDDIDVNRMILVKILGTLGATCETAENGREAVEKFERSQPGAFNLILMDVQMPVMNGYDATREIRSGAHPWAEKVAIVAMTANAFVDDIREALEAGMDAHVAKPIVLDQLKSTIQEVLERKNQCI